MHILLTGATGLVGQKLMLRLLERGDRVTAVTRNASRVYRRFPHEQYPLLFPVEADLAREILPQESLLDVDAVVHLMGESVADGRWTEAKKKRMVESRVLSGENLIKSFQKLPEAKLRTLISASAIGFYGDRGDEELTESSKGRTDFLSELCRRWEASVVEPELSSVRKVIFRIGLVLSSEGGFLERLLPIFKRGLGGNLGDGKQWMSWIHLEDLVEMIIWALDQNLVEGVFNAVSPQPIQNRKFTRQLARQLKRPAFFPVPRLAAKLALGEMAGMIFASQKVFPARATELGFQFRHRDFETAIERLLAKNK